MPDATSNRSAVSATETEKSPWFLELLAVIFTVLAMVLSGMVATAQSDERSVVIGATFSPPISLLVILGLATLFGMRKRRTRAKVALVVGLLFTLGQCTQFSQIAQQEISEDTSAATP